MSLFRLPCWVVKRIDQIRRDFLWSGSDLEHPGCRLVSWTNLCRPHDQGGWGILGIDTFNQALLRKWWWKFLTFPGWCGSEVIQFNYGMNRWNMFPRLTSRISFFWKGVLNCLPAFRSCIAHNVQSGWETLFWKDQWLDGRAPRFLWQDRFASCLHPNGSIRELSALLEQPPFVCSPLLNLIRDTLRAPNSSAPDKKIWRLTGNGAFSVKSFYYFICDGGVRCPVAKFFWSSICPKKINLFNWLAWKDKILTLENLAKRRCNRPPSSLLQVLLS
ncbi:uncharacterized mitochondrial protein AtMg00310-like [Dioscorea cayenensis subsp. rotundata]|uniref:Uncharacterized mitochondrial protein AtMg00310-like n=1 Tax=Dioscorea cayennensis subsp. rotundata TaxID=55577 RepID=A0AB40BSA8_DIOCR|nr:uncharacterized mitochondrial protein AtMg00310-like [Dioscorea cayenensis subsp. rotundata]